MSAFEREENIRLEATSLGSQQPSQSSSGSLRIQVSGSSLQHVLSPSQKELGTDDRIKLLCSLTAEQALRRGGEFQLSELQIMARRLKVPVYQSKEILIDAIKEKFQNKAKLDDILASTDSDTSTHRKTINTFPRLLGFLMSDPDALSRSRTLSSRTELQLQETNSDNPVYVEATLKFNDSQEPGKDIPSSPYSDEDNERISSFNLNTSFVPQGTLTPQRSFQMLKDVQRKYAKSRSNWERSGSHEHGFFPFCFGDSDVLVLHLWVLHVGDPDMTRFMCEGTEIAGGLDTGKEMPKPLSTPSKRDRSDSDSKLVEELKLRRIADGAVGEVLKEEARAEILSIKRRDRILMEDRVRSYESQGDYTSQSYQFAKDDFERLTQEILKLQNAE